MTYHFLAVFKKIKPVSFSCILLLMACSSSDDSTNKNNNDQRRITLETLAVGNALEVVNQKNELENADINDSFLMNKTERANKLSELYQNILTIEPSGEVRTKISYRLAQIDTLAYELNDDISGETGEKDKPLASLVKLYKDLLVQYPNRAENEEVYYQLAKALDLQGKPSESLKQIDLMLEKFPNSRYTAELYFRRGDIYYNLQYYTKALKEYQAVIQSKNANNYYVNSVYMSGWTLFKLNRLNESNTIFLSLIDYLIAQEKIQPYEYNFSFDALDNRYVDLIKDIQRLISISLSQQRQSASLIELVKNHEQSKNHNHKNKNSLYLYRHILFSNLADFLLENGLKHDAELTYKAYLTLAPNSIWAARYNLLLMDLYRQQGKNKAIQALEIQYVEQFGLNSDFWQQTSNAAPTSFANSETLVTEILPNLLSFSYKHSRYLYAQAQSITEQTARISAFSNAANWLSTYLLHAKLPEAEMLINELPLSDGLLADEMLFADASFEARKFRQALTSYEYIAYLAPSSLNPKTSDEGIEKLHKEAAYATTLTIREILSVFHLEAKSKNKLKTKKQKTINTETEYDLIMTRNRLDQLFIEHYPSDDRSLALAVQQAQFAYENEDYKNMEYYAYFILSNYGVINKNSVLVNNQTRINKKYTGDNTTVSISHKDIASKLDQKSVKQVQIASQLLANYWYQKTEYIQAENAYQLALNYVKENSNVWKKMRELLSASIYFQGKALVQFQPLTAVQHYLRLGQLVPESSYRLNAHFDAANIYFSEQKWEEAIAELLAFQKQYPTHEYSESIPAKLAQSYENIEQWEKAANQYLAIATVNGTTPQAEELQREALYSAAELYVKSNNLTKAISTFRSYAHTYPEPFNIAQEVRFKMSGFYQQTKEPNKEYFWYRKIIQYYDKHFKTSTKTPVSRDLYLASVSALALAEAHQQTFNHIKLTLPLNKSLARKQKAMKIAIDYYKKLLAFQLAEFVPNGTYNLGQMYRQLSQSVMSSERPEGLDEFALEEYGFLLEEIVYPFEEKAIEIHVNNAKRSWQNVYDQWIAKSFIALAELDPALYDRKYDRSFQSNNQNNQNSQNKQTNIQEGDIDAVRTLH